MLCPLPATVIELILAWEIALKADDAALQPVDCTFDDDRFAALADGVTAHQRYRAPDQRWLLAVDGARLRFAQLRREQFREQTAQVWREICAVAEAKLAGTEVGSLDKLMRAASNVIIRPPPASNAPPPLPSRPSAHIADLPDVLRLCPYKPDAASHVCSARSPTEQAVFDALSDLARSRGVAPLPAPLFQGPLSFLAQWGYDELVERFGLGIDMVTRLFWASGGGGDALDEQPAFHLDPLDGLLRVDPGTALDQKEYIVVSADLVEHYGQGLTASTLSVMAALASAIVPCAIAITIEVGYLSTAWIDLVLLGCGSHHGLLDPVFTRPGGRVYLLIASYAGQQALHHLREADEILIMRFRGRRVLSYYLVDAAGPIPAHTKALFGVGIKDGRHIAFASDGLIRASGRRSSPSSLQQMGRHGTRVVEETLSIEVVPLRSRAGHDILSEINARFNHLAAAGRLIHDRYALHEQAEWDEHAKAFRATSRMATSIALRTSAEAAERKYDQRRRLEGLTAPLTPPEPFALAQHLRLRLLTDADREGLAALSSPQPPEARQRASSGPPSYGRKSAASWWCASTLHGLLALTLTTDRLATRALPPTSTSSSSSSSSS